MLTKKELLEHTKRVITHYSKTIYVPCFIVEADAVFASGAFAAPIKTCLGCSFAKKNFIFPCIEQSSSAIPPVTAKRDFLYFCPLKKAFWGSPILYHDEVLAYVFAYTSLDKNEILPLSAWHNLPNSEEFFWQIAAVWQQTPLRIQTLAQSLFFCCHCLSWSSDLPCLPPAQLLWKSNYTQNSAVTINSQDLTDCLLAAFHPQESLKQQHTKVQMIAHWLLQLIQKTRVLHNTPALLTDVGELDNITDSLYKIAFNLQDSGQWMILAKVLRYIHQNYHTDISMKKVCQAVNLSYSYFSRLFKKELGINFNDYLTQVRIQKSKSLLLLSQLPLVEVAQACGFRDQSYFTKIFKKFYGYGPGEFRFLTKTYLHVPQS